MTEQVKQVTPTKNGNTRVSEKIASIQDDRTSRMFAQLETYLEKPEKLELLNLNELKSLWKTHSNTTHLGDLDGIDSQQNSKAQNIGLQPPPRQKLNELGHSIRLQIDRRLGRREWGLSLSFILVYLAGCAWLLMTETTKILPFYIVLGAMGCWILAKWSDRLLLGRWFRSLSVFPSPQGIILLPLSTLGIMAVIFLAPGQIGINAQQMATVITATPITISYNSTVAIGDPLPLGFHVKLENSGKSKNDFIRVSTQDGRVGFVPVKTLTSTTNNTLKLLKSSLLWTLTLTLTAIGIVQLLNWYYITQVMPVVLKRLARKQNLLLRKKIEETQLLEKFRVDDRFDINLDLLDAKNQLVNKITERHQEQALKIIESETLTQKDKEMMIQRLTQWTVEALETT